MSKLTVINRVSIILALSLGLVWPAAEAGALSAEWKSLSGRERIIIRLDTSDGRLGEVARATELSIGLSFSSGSKDFTLAAPAMAKLFGGVESSADGLHVNLKTAEFGFIVTSPAQNILHLDIFADPLGGRWKPESFPAVPAAPDAGPTVSAASDAAASEAGPSVSASAPSSVAPGGVKPEAQPGTPAAVVDPDTAFSQKAEPYVGKAAESPAAAQGGKPADDMPPVAVDAPPVAPLPQNGRANQPLDEGDSYRLPEWPPMEMPSSLPVPPPPPPSGTGLWPVFEPENGVTGGIGGISNIFVRTGEAAAPQRFSWSDFLPFASAAQAAGATREEEERLVQAPFAYRGKLNVDGDPNWNEQPVPVLVYVPADMVLGERGGVPAAQAAAEPPQPEALAQPANEPPLPVASAQPAARPPLPEAPAQPANEPPPPAASAQPAARPPLPEAPAQPANEPPPPAASAQPANEPTPPAPVPAASARPVIYVDEQGNPVEPPLEPEAALSDVDAHFNNGTYAEAIAVLDKLIGQHNLSQAQREIALHRKADAMFSLYEKDLAAHYQEVVDSSIAAVNFNTRSPRNAAAYLRLGYTSIVGGNSYEAAGYFNVLRREYPNYNNLPLTYYYWGDYQYAQGNLNDAVEQFNYIVNNYPDHPISRDAALGLSRSYYRMGRFDDAFQMMLFVEQRWPNFYIDYPPMLSMLGDVSYRVGDLDKARASYWLYYNLVPNAEDADMILTRLGDIYSSGKYHSAAAQVYGEAVKRFPSKDGGVISLMRIAEEGVYDNPSLSGMVKVFERPYDQRPVEAYRKIISEYPGSPLVTLAKLKLAMWTMWQKDYVTVFDLCSEIIAEAPNSPLAERAREVSMSAFTFLAAEDANDKRYSRAREVWDRYPILQTQAEFLNPESRLSLAVSQWNTGSNTEALATLEPFFYGSKIGEVSEMGLFLALNIMTEHYQWEKIEELAQRVELWELTPQADNQMDYALALAYENLDRPGDAAPLWSGIYAARLLPPTQMANAAFYLARSAERERDLESAYHVGQDALARLSGVLQTDPEHADTEKIKTQLVSLLDIAESSNALQQALGYAEQYLQYADADSLDQQSIIYRMARIHKKRGDTGEWLRLLEDLSGKYPDSVFGKTAKSELASHRLDSDAARFSNTQL